MCSAFEVATFTDLCDLMIKSSLKTLFHLRLPLILLSGVYKLSLKLLLWQIAYVLAHKGKSAKKCVSDDSAAKAVGQSPKCSLV